MKFIKGLFYGLATIIIALCAFILVCAVNPALTEKVAGATAEGGALSKIAALLPGGDDEEEGGDATASGDVSVSEPEDEAEDGDAVIIELPGNSQSPDNLSHLTGYLPVSSEEEKITDEVAESIKKELSTGQTGEGFKFDTNIYPYYGMLTPDEQAVYRQIYANALSVVSSFAPVKAINTSQLSNIFESVVNDHPELFYLDTSYSVKYTKSGSVVEIQLVYYTLANALETAKANFSSAAKAVIAGASELPGDYEKEKYVHDYLVSNVSYADGAVLSQSAYSALVNGISVCAGYARANQYILQQLGIPCYYCTGYAGEDHAWNIVKLSDGYYNEDITWDDTNPSTYDYFNRSDKDFAPSHTRTGLSVNLPPCNASSYKGPEEGTVASPDAGDPASVADTNNFEPLRYDDLYPANNGNESGTNGNTSTATPGREELVAALEKLGLKESDAVWDMDEYYADCKKKLVAAGTGDKHFTVIIPSSLFKSIESSYGKGDYKKGYVDEALKSLGMNRFSIQIQAERMGGGFYKLYHNVVSWKEEETAPATTGTTTTTDSTTTNSTTTNSTTTNSTTTDTTSGTTTNTNTTNTNTTNTTTTDTNTTNTTNNNTGGTSTGTTGTN